MNNEVFVDPEIGKQAVRCDRPHARFRRGQKGQGTADRRAGKRTDTVFRSWPCMSNLRNPHNAFDDSAAVGVRSEPAGRAAGRHRQRRPDRQAGAGRHPRARARDRARGRGAVRRAVVRRRDAGARPGHRDRLEVRRRRHDARRQRGLHASRRAPRSLLTAERAALNFLQLLSGVATRDPHAMSTSSPAPRRPSSTRARRCRACARRRSTRCASAAARTSAWRCSTAS